MTGPAGIDASKPPLLTVSPVTPLAAHDADTFRVAFEMRALLPGATAGWTEDVRLAHVNAAELSTTAGHAAWLQVEQWLHDHPVLTLHAWGREKYGRLLGDVEAADGSLLSAFVLGLGGTKPMALREQLEVHDGQA